MYITVEKIVFFLLLSSCSVHAGYKVHHLLRIYRNKVYRVSEPRCSVTTELQEKQVVMFTTQYTRCHR